jgi:hypothetical protein
MRSDPSDTGGLFVGRRPGTALTRYAAPPQPDGALRRRADGMLSHLLFTAMVLISVLCWGPIPIGCLWLGSRANYLSGNVEIGIVVSFGSAGVALFGALKVMQRIDGAWVLVRRAAGHDQRNGSLPRIFALTAILGAVIFTVWFLVILGPNDPNL